MKHLLINLFVISFLLALIPDGNDIKWINIQNKSIQIEYLQDKYPWCKSSIVLNNSIDEILNIIENISNYENIFDSVLSSIEYNDNIVHIIYDLPGIFANRDYVVKFNKFFDKNILVYEFISIKENKIKINNDFVRLINAGGQWRLKSLDNYLTEVTYIWNGDIAGKFPNWALKRAWIKQGNEVLGNLKTALDENGDS